MTWQEFIAHWTNKPVDFDGIYPNQCMDLMHQYVYDVLNLTDKTILAAPLARLVFENFDTISGHQYFQKVVNTLTNVPEPGDIIFWGIPAGYFKDKNGKVVYGGHVSIFYSGDVNKFTSFDANWPEDSLPHLQEHDYLTPPVLGWLHPLPQQIEQTPTVSVVQDQLKKEAEALTQCQQQSKAFSDQLTQALSDKTTLQNNNNELQLENANLKKENDNLINEVATLTTDRKNYNDEANLSNTQATQLAANLDSIAGHAGITDTKGLDDNQLTNEINAKFSEQTDTINKLNDQLKPYLSMKTTISQTVSPQNIGILKKLFSWVFVSTPNK